MGIGNSSAIRSAYLAGMYSLPLMGIGNSISHVVSALPAHLITPHGDRERSPNTSPSPAPRLITPHGDREPTDAISSIPRARSHYPSWGSGTLLLHVLVISPEIHSLPLMGIGNPPTNWFDSIINGSLPLMGIGNPEFELGAKGYTNLITPHGDRELACTSICECRRRWCSLPLMGIGNRKEPRVMTPSLHSLPLMGIGNGGRGPGGGGVVRLITPHGDRELAVGVGRLRRLISSLPLMGIGNPHLVSLPSAEQHHSLPLMGIGNCSWNGLREGWFSSHYPSWGSGTHRFVRGEGDDQDSLPLMGIGNPIPPDIPPPRPPGLITPHGDRELGAKGHPEWARRAHYPSWGSGTCGRLSTGRATGHGSLPLMGIGNLGDARVYSRQAELITPHGDREPGRHNVRDLDTLDHSLPLMGIGNPRVGGSDGPRGAPLITPHGDREPVRRRGDPERPVPLITPHGDRELGRLRLNRGGGIDLITPHGDREHERGATWARSYAASLPLMGIGNLASPLSRGCPRRLITPHGDREHYFPRASLAPTGDSLPLMGIGNLAADGSANRR